MDRHTAEQHTAPTGTTFVVPARSSCATLGHALSAIRRVAPDHDVVVVFDGRRCECERQAAERHRARQIVRARHCGPGASRNVGARHSSGDLIFFVDADVVLADDALEHALARMDDETIAGVIGRYRAVAAGSRLTRLKNLHHSFVHGSRAGAVASFWGACSVIRRRDLEAIGGFDEDLRYCEDVELGARLARAQRTVVLDPAMRGHHLKEYTLRSWARSEVFERAVPWTTLILARRAPAGVLNTDLRATAGVVASLVLAGAVALVPWSARARVASVVATGAVVATNAGFVRFVRRRSPRLVPLVVPYLVGHSVLAAVGAALAIGRVLRARHDR